MNTPNTTQEQIAHLKQAIYKASGGDFEATDDEVREIAAAMSAPPVPATVQEIMRLMGPWVAACASYSQALERCVNPAEKQRRLTAIEKEVDAAYKPLEAVLTALVDDNHRLKFELAGVNAMRRPLIAAARAALEAWDKTPEWFDVPENWTEPMNKAMVILNLALSASSPFSLGIEPEQGESHE